jgi:hypothetical protein
MCDALIIGIAATVAGVAGQAAEAAGQASAQNKQKSAYDTWVAQQDQARNLETQRQDTLRQRAEAAQQVGLTTLSSDQQKQRQADEETRLSNYLTNQTPSAPTVGAPVSVADRALTGQGGGDPALMNDLAGRINDATTQAKNRIAALARVSSFGGSSGGLSTTADLSLQQSGRGIDAANNARQGSLGAYNLEHTIEPIQIKHTPSATLPLTNASLMVGTSLLGAQLAGAAVPKIPAFYQV